MFYSQLKKYLCIGMLVSGATLSLSAMQAELDQDMNYHLQRSDETMLEWLDRIIADARTTQDNKAHLIKQREFIHQINAFERVIELKEKIENF